MTESTLDNLIPASPSPKKAPRPLAVALTNVFPNSFAIRLRDE